ncbi:shaker-related potassium channel tsha2-like [Bolinopsis microptera]|uniref:shaker-related potassium channel tsha2-like n=1 Tax=Bolinopsis microptera TaxID=2820187 RepID=UPI0030796163
MMALSHLSATKLPRVRHSIRNTIARQEVEEERAQAYALSLNSPSSAASSLGSFTTGRAQASNPGPATISVPTSASFGKKVKKRISMAAVGHTAFGSLMRRGHVHSLRQKNHIPSKVLAELELSSTRKTSIKRSSIVGAHSHTAPFEPIPEPVVNNQNTPPRTINPLDFNLDTLPEDPGLDENETEDEMCTELLSMNGNVPDGDLIFINCSGFRYVTTEETLSRFPNSLLGNAKLRQALYSQKLDAYYLDRHRACFESILQFYQTGIECPPPYIDLHIYHSEKDFYGLKRSRDTVIEIRENRMKESSCLCCPHSSRLKIHKFLINPPNSICSSLYHATDITMIALATVLFILESEETLKDKFQLTLGHLSDSYGINFWLFALDAMTIGWFTVDIMLRMVSWPQFIEYWKDFMNLLDIFSVAPFYIELIQLATANESDNNYDFLRALRLIRVVRVFKFVRHSESMMVILKAVVKARHELLVLFVSIFLFVITFGSIMFYLEHDVPEDQMPPEGSRPNTPSLPS